MIITEVGKRVFSLSQLNWLRQLDDSSYSVINALGAKPLLSLSHTNSSVFVIDSIVLKRGNSAEIKNEVKMLTQLSSGSHLFTPVYAYGKDFFLMPLVNGVTLRSAIPNLSSQLVRDMATSIADAFSCADIYPNDLHWENVIITNNGYFVIDAGKYKFMNDDTRLDFCDLIDEVYDMLTCNYREVSNRFG